MKYLPLYPTLPELAADTAVPSSVRGSCTDCGLHEGVRNPCLGAEVIDGDPERTLLVLLPEPTGDDDRGGRPFVSHTGQYVRRTLQVLGWTGRVVLDYAIRCAPGSRKVSPKVVPTCRQYTSGVMQEIAASGRLVGVLAFGSESVESVVGRAYPPQSCQGGYVWSTGPQPYVVHILQHPARALRNVFIRRELENTLAEVIGAMLVDGGAVQAFQPPPLSATYGVLENVADAEHVLEQCEFGATVDFETNGRSHDDDRALLSLAMTPFGTDEAFVFRYQDLIDSRITSLLVPWLEGPAPKSGHFGSFDVGRAFTHLGAKVQNYSMDTGLLRRMVDPGVLGRLEYAQPLVGMGGGKDEVAQYKLVGSKEISRALKDTLLVSPPTAPYMLSVAHFTSAVRACAAQDLDSTDNRGSYLYAFVPPDVLHRYNALDTVSSERLRRYYLRRAGAEFDGANLKHWNEIVVPMHRAVVAIETAGLKVNRAAIADIQTTMAATIADFETKYPGISPNSADDVAALLLQKHRLKLPRRAVTALGKPSFTQETLGALHHPVADDILAWRKAIKFKGQYADGILGYVQDDGRVHCHYNIDGAESGRPSANDPNMLNIPARGPNASACRGVFVAEDGYVLLEGDYSQVELRVAAMLSGDPVMIQMFKDGVDFHTATSVMIAPLLGVDSTDQAAMDALRGQSKIVNFALLYGDPDEGLAHKLGCDVRTAAKLRAAILGKFKRLAKWIEECQAATRRSGVCRTVWDGEPRRVRKLYDVADPNSKGHDSSVRSSWNTPVQGSATEYTNASLGAIQSWLDEHPAVPARLVLTVYDSIMLEVHEDWVEDVAHVVKDIMESWPSSGVPIVSELKVGKDWGHMAKLKLAA